MSGTKFKNVTDAHHKSFRDDPNDASLTMQAVELAVDTEGAVLSNLKTLEMKGISLDDYICAGDEIVSLTDGTLIKAEVCTAIISSYYY